MKKCEECGNELPPARNKKARFCNTSCRSAKYKRESKITGDSPMLQNKGSTGAISELLACAELLKRGYSVFRSVSPACSCDIVAFGNSGKLIRVEVKTAYKFKSGCIQCHVPKSQIGKHDVLAQVFLATGQIVFIPPIESF